MVVWVVGIVRENPTKLNPNSDDADLVVVEEMHVARTGKNIQALELSEVLKEINPPLIDDLAVFFRIGIVVRTIGFEHQLLLNRGDLPPQTQIDHAVA